MSESFEIIPLDTLFFRGSTPMESGMMNVVSVFPPPVSVIKGAFWTTLHLEKGDFKSGLDEKGNIPLEVTGIFIKKINKENKELYYAPAPATWYYDNDKKISSGEKLDGIKLIEAKKMQETEKLGMTSSADDVVFVKAEKDSKSLSGAWVLIDFLKNPKSKFGKNDVLFEGDILTKENRTNVALDSNRKAKDGQLFSSTHLRLNDGISLVVCFKEKLSLPDEGKLLFGGEKRISKFKRISENSLNSLSSNSNGEVFVSFVPVEATDESVNSIVSSGKIFATAGWDLAKGFHKPTMNWIPAGAVFNTKINDSCVALKSVPAK